MSVRKFDVGDEVEFTRRGEVRYVGKYAGRPTVDECVNNGLEYLLYADDRVTLIKAAPPVWKRGDAARITSRCGRPDKTIVRDACGWNSDSGDRWCDDTITDYWRSGLVEVVFTA